MRSTAVFALLLGIFAAFAAAWSKEGKTILAIASLPNWCPCRASCARCIPHMQTSSSC